MSKFKRSDGLLDNPPGIELFIGVDPGIEGGIAAIGPHQELILLKDWPGNEVDGGSG